MRAKVKTNAGAKCRTCNAKSTNLFLLRDHEPYTKRTFAELLVDIAKIDIKADNVHCNLPKHICGNCSLKLTSAYSFVKQAQQVNASLLAAVRNVQQRKKQPIIDEEGELIVFSPELKADMVDEETLDECLERSVHREESSIEEEEEIFALHEAVTDFDPITTRNNGSWSNTFENVHISGGESLSSNGRVVENVDFMQADEGDTLSTISDTQPKRSEPRCEGLPPGSKMSTAVQPCIIEPSHAELRQWLKNEMAGMKKNFQTEINQINLDMKNLTTDIFRKIEALTEKVTPISGNISKLRFEMQLPVKKKSELNKLEKVLLSGPQRDFLIKDIRVFGGKNANRFCQNICKYLFSDEVLNQYSWVGTKTKLPFSSLKNVLEIIREAVRTRFPSFTDNDLGNFFKEYLKQSKNRIKRQKPDELSFSSKSAKIYKKDSNSSSGALMKHEDNKEESLHTEM